MRRVIWWALRAVLLAAPFLIHLGTGSMSFEFFGPALPDWTIAATIAAALGALILVVHDVRALMKTKATISTWIFCATALIVVAPFVGVLLFYLIEFLAAVAMIPYSAALVAMGARVVHRWRDGPAFRAGME